MTILICVGVFLVSVIGMCFVSRHIARIVGSALLAHADALDAYRDRLNVRTEHWYGLSTERQQPVRMEKRVVNG